MNNDSNWRSVFGKHRNTRLKDHELILRFLAMRERGDRYTRPMREFLNQFADDYNKMNADKLSELKALFVRTIKACWDAKQRQAFRPVRSLNAAVFEGVMLGVAARLSHTGTPASPEEIARAYDRLLADATFTRACTSSTALEESVRIRRMRAIETFSQSA